MIVVADTGPLHYLCLIGLLDILPALYGDVFVPRSVVGVELSDAATPESLRILYANPPRWLVVRDDPMTVPPSLAALGLGERHAISVFLELKGDLLLCDDAAARRKAEQFGITVTGTLGILEEGAARGLLNFEQAIDYLTAKTNFRHSQPLIDRIRERHRARSEKSNAP